MKISLKWLNDFIDIADFLAKPEALSEILTKSGLEVESIENKAKAFENVVVGSILEKGKHPDADRLTLCQVTTGKGVVHQIVCGAKNHNSGDNVVVALPGAILPGNFEIKKSKIRGVESSGMLCSEVELGIAENSDGIMILPKDAPIGKPFAEYMGYDDIVMEIKVTPNRSDCLSHYGLAREISCVTDRPLNSFVKDNLAKLQPAGDTQKKIKLEIKNPQSCPRYTGAFIDKIKIGPSPSWLKKRLESVGMKSISNVVDITNYVMMELGQPLHAFDYREIKGKQITVENSKNDEKFKTLDGTELTMNGTELMIRDGERAVALAGIVGGLNSGIKDDTSEVFIESAYFKPEVVRRTSRRHGIQTESGYRFTRAVDPDMVFTAMKRACQLIQDLAGGQVYGNAYDMYVEKIHQKSIVVTLNYVSDRLGYTVNPKKFVDWIQRLGCTISGKDGEYNVVPPLYRSDIQIADDLVEEYARLNGYDQIPESLPALADPPTQHDKKYTLGLQVNALLRGQGFQEAVNYNFVDSKYYQMVGPSDSFVEYGLNVTERPIKLLNPISEDMDIMRNLIAPSLLKNVIHNFNRGVESGRLFESGYVFYEELGQYIEPWHLGLALWGNDVDLWNKKNVPAVFQLKSKVENFLKGFGKSFSWDVPQKIPNFLHPGQTARLRFEGRAVGFIGTVHPVLVEEFKLRADTALAEFSLEKLLQGQPRVNRVKPLSKFPSVARDLAFVMPATMMAQSVVDEIQKTGKPLLDSVKAFDVFFGQPLKPSEKSVAFRLVYQDPSETLTEQKIAEINSKIVNSVCQKLGISVR